MTNHLKMSTSNCRSTNSSQTKQNLHPIAIREAKELLLIPHDTVKDLLRAQRSPTRPLSPHSGQFFNQVPLQRRVLKGVGDSAAASSRHVPPAACGCPPQPHSQALEMSIKAAPIPEQHLQPLPEHHGKNKCISCSHRSRARTPPSS